MTALITVCLLQQYAYFSVFKKYVVYLELFSVTQVSILINEENPLMLNISRYLFTLSPLELELIFKTPANTTSPIY